MTRYNTVTTMKRSKTEFLGIQYNSKDGSKKVIKPDKKVKKEVENHLNKDNEKE